MKKRIITIAAALMMATAPAMAQVFIMEEDDYQGNRTAANPGVMVPMEDVDFDQYVPVGEGVMLLAGMAGAYLLGKRKKEQ